MLHGQTIGWVLLVGILGAGGGWTEEPDWENRAVAALAAGDAPELRTLATEYRQLPPETRRALPLRIRPQSVEFSYRGEFPGDQEPWNFLEYLVAAESKGYEALLVASENELTRIQLLRPLFEPRADGTQCAWSARLVWIEDASPQSVGLGDLVFAVDRQQLTDFRNRLAVREAGLGSTVNLVADPGSLPGRRVPALVQLTVRLEP